MKYLIIRCELCHGKEYVVKYEKCQTKQLRILDFAVCPMGHPRRPQFYERYMKDWVCQNCKVPSPFVTPKNSEICESCYFSFWWRSKVAKNKEVIQLP